MAEASRGKNYVPGNHTNTEDSYVGCIREVIKVLKLNEPIVCGASMAGQVCVSVAIRAEEVGWSWGDYTIARLRLPDNGSPIPR